MFILLILTKTKLTKALFVDTSNLNFLFFGCLKHFYHFWCGLRKFILGNVCYISSFFTLNAYWTSISFYIKSFFTFLSVMDSVKELDDLQTTKIYFTRYQTSYPCDFNKLLFFKRRHLIIPTILLAREKKNKNPVSNVCIHFIQI